MGYLEIFAIATGLAGHWLISNQDVRGYYAWIAGNLAFIVMQYNVGLYGMAGLFVVYTLLSIRGIIKWKAKQEGSYDQKN